ncbi:MAG: hypothetical protein SGJ27_12025 [Candidatus Melainabacteria bacterium]|nr:hypothetical protein [Candidatus Melainabacteria bacterium]
MTCDCCAREKLPEQLLQKLTEVEQDLTHTAQRIVKAASDPFSGVIRFLEDRPENTSLHGYFVDRALVDTFGGRDQIPGLIRAIASHVRHVIRHANVINIVNEHPTAERWGQYVIKQTENMRFEIAVEKGYLTLKNIKGLFGIEHGIELPLEQIIVKPPKLVVTANMGLFKPQKVFDI